MQVLKLRAICSHCHREAAFTHRLGDEKDVEVHPCSTCAGLLCTTITTVSISWSGPLVTASHVGVILTHCPVPSLA